MQSYSALESGVKHVQETRENSADGAAKEIDDATAKDRVVKEMEDTTGRDEGVGRSRDRAAGGSRDGAGFRL